MKAGGGKKEGKKQGKYCCIVFRLSHQFQNRWFVVVSGRDDNNHHHDGVSLASIDRFSESVALLPSLSASFFSSRKEQYFIFSVC